MSDDTLPDDILWHQSGINPRGEPFVQLLRGNKILGQMNPEQARDHARAILEAAEAAEQDAFLWDFAHQVIRVGDPGAFNLIRAFREYRARTTGKSQGPTRPGDWVMPEKDR